MSLKDFKNMSKIVSKYLNNSSTTFDSELLKAGKHFLGSDFRGVFASDRIPNLKNGESAIVNLDTHNEPGSHWTAFYKHGKLTIIYDSFGRPVKNIFKSLRFGSGKKIDYKESNDYDAEQLVEEENCGQYSLAFLMFIKKYGVEKALKI